MAFRKKILMLATKISLECGTYTGVTPTDPEYMILDPVVTDEMADVGMHVKVRRPRHIEEIARKDSVAGDLAATLERNRTQYAEMVREAYRNYRHNNYLTYLFSSRDFADMARKIVILREVASLRERKMRDIEQLAAYAKMPLASTVLVLNYKYKALDRRKALAQAIEKNGLLFESKKVPEYKMPAFITGMFQQRSLPIEPKAAQMLSDCVGNDLARLDKELSKLEIIVAEKGLKRVTPELVEENVGISKEYNNFELQRAIASRDVLKANRIIQHFGKNPKNNPIQLTLAVLFNYFSNLLACYYAKDRSEAGLMAALGLRGSFQLKDYLAGMKNYSAMKVFNLIGEIRNADARSKGVGNVSASDTDIMKELVYKILH